MVGRISRVIDPAGLGGHSHAVRFCLNLVDCEKMSALDPTLQLMEGQTQGRCVVKISSRPECMDAVRFWLNLADCEKMSVLDPTLQLMEGRTQGRCMVKISSRPECIDVIDKFSFGEHRCWGNKIIRMTLPAQRRLPPLVFTA